MRLPGWQPLRSAVLALAANQPFDRWADDDRSAVLYAVARDNECQYLAHELRRLWPELLCDLADLALRAGEPDARWQLADELGCRSDGDPRREQLLLALADDADEYVRRRALGSLARIASPATERLALAAWDQSGERQEWARMNALWALARVGSPHLGRLLDSADADGRQYLVRFAARLRAGEPIE